jgi:phosphoglycerol geranylgeranyltransferase
VVLWESDDNSPVFHGTQAGTDMTGPIEKHLLNEIRQQGAIHLTLLDPEKARPRIAAKNAHQAENYGTAAIMVGGSTVTSTRMLEETVKAVKKAVKIPVILFPNNITGICPGADAIWFMSLINSSDPYFIIGAHILGAPLVKRFGLEPIPLGYIIVGEGGVASLVGRAFPIPLDKPEMAAAHALAAQYLGMRFVYLEAGSGVTKSVPPDMIKMVSNVIHVPLIVGGGIKSVEQVEEVVEAGAKIVVTGNIIEEGNTKIRLKELISGVKRK